MAHHRDWDLACKVYVGNLGESATKHELESVFHKYGPTKNVWVARNPPGFAFIEFEDPRDAEDAVRELDGTRICGSRIKCEMSHGKTKRSDNFGGRGGGREPFRRRSPYSQRRGYSGGNERGYYAGGGERKFRSRSRSPLPPPPPRKRYSKSRSRSPRSRSRSLKDRRSASRSPPRY